MIQNILLAFKNKGAEAWDTGAHSGTCWKVSTSRAKAGFRKRQKKRLQKRAEARPEGSVSPAEWERGQVRGGGRTPETMQMEQHGRILKRELSKKINNRREETRSTTQLCLYTFCKNTYRGIYIKHITRIYEKQYNMMVKSTNSSSMCIWILVLTGISCGTH